MTDILTPISPGELLDKLTILRLKCENITDEDKLVNVKRERELLQRVVDDHIALTFELQEAYDALYIVNSDLWAIEDDIRKCEFNNDFGVAFIALARAVYVTNDERAKLKKEINVLLGSQIVEEKSYHDYQ